MTDTLTRQNPLLKSIAAFFVVFGVLPVLVITFGLVFLNSNFSMYHFKYRVTNAISIPLSIGIIQTQCDNCL